jgi:hypothetical protein
MTTSELIASLAGPMLMVLGTAMLLNGRVFLSTTAKFGENPAFIFLAGLLALVVGLAVVRTHNLWVDDWRVIVTILGWHAIVGGVVNVIAPNAVSAVRRGIGDNRWMVGLGGIVAFCVGAFLADKGWHWTGN